MHCSSAPPESKYRGASRAGDAATRRVALSSHLAPPNQCLQRTGALGSGLTSRGRAPMVVGGRRGRSVPFGARR